MNDQDHVTIGSVDAQTCQQQLQARIALLEEENRKLKDLNAQKDKFLSMIAHDLRTPFTSLLAFTRFVADDFDNFSCDELKEVMEDMRCSAENLYNLLENLLIWSKIQQGTIAYYPKILNIQDVVTHNLALLASHADRKQITFRNTLPNDALILADHWMVDLIIRNVLSNALKFTRTQGEITVGATQNEDEVRVSVADTGIGIEAEDLPKLFRMDIRYKVLGTQNEQGTGLGLLICKALVETHGGQIWVESQVDKGTTVTFTLPKGRLE
jgi:signal transduction histidine kinase